MKIIDADEIVYESIDSSDTAKYEYEHGTGIFAVRKEDIDAMPTIQSEPHWIPCSAGLPKTNDPVNVTYVNHNPGNYYAEVKDKPYTATAHFHKGQWYAESWIQINILGMCICLSRRKIKLER